MALPVVAFALMFAPASRIGHGGREALDVTSIVAVPLVLLGFGIFLQFRINRMARELESRLLASQTPTALSEILLYFRMVLTWSRSTARLPESFRLLSDHAVKLLSDKSVTSRIDLRELAAAHLKLAENYYRLDRQYWPLARALSLHLHALDGASYEGLKNRVNKALRFCRSAECAEFFLLK